MMTDMLLGVDPGQRTGICCIYFAPGSVQLGSYFDIPNGVSGVLEWWTRHLPTIKASSCTIVMEDFTTREGKFGIDHTPERVIGAVKALADMHGIKVIMRPPAGRLKQVPDAVLRRLGVHLAGKGNRNAKEAVRHCVAVLKARKHPAVLAAFDEEV